MRQLRHTVTAALTGLMVLLPAMACGPDFPTATFVLRTRPDGEYAKYADGQLGVLQADFLSRNLVIAYRVLDGNPLPAEVQREAVAVDKFISNRWSDGDGNDQAPDPGFDAWVKARDAFGKVDGYSPDGANGSGCLSPAYTMAAKTLAERIAAYGKTDAVVEWVRGQDGVFSRCDPAPRYDEKGQRVTPTEHVSPQTAVNGPSWLMKDRAYQLAATLFYNKSYEEALASFRAIAADKDSSWAVTARYMEARVLIEQAQTAVPDYPAQPTPEQVKAGEKKRHELFVQAEVELTAMRTEARMRPIESAIEDMQDLVRFHTEPEQQTVRLAARLVRPVPVKYAQWIKDFTLLNTSFDQYGEPVPTYSKEAQTQMAEVEALRKAVAAGRSSTALARGADMADWVDTLNHHRAEHAAAQWKATPTKLWLVAALMLADEKTPELPAMLEAARAVPREDAAWLTVTYNRLRLEPQSAAHHEEIARLAEELGSASPSVANQFRGLAAASAGSLTEWLGTLARTPVNEDDFEPGENYWGVTSDLCGDKVSKKNPVRLFDTDGAVVLNNDLPLETLAQAAEQKVLPRNLRYALAQATWARAVLLDRPEIARRMTPILEGCHAQWRPVLAAYDGAKTPEDRHAYGLMAMMRFPSVEPSVRENVERREGALGYDYYRQNWWSTPVPAAGETVDDWTENKRQRYGVTEREGEHSPAVRVPSFLSGDQIARAHREVTQLNAKGAASSYFAVQALKWQRKHPRDARTPEILGLAYRVLRNAERDDPDPRPKPKDGEQWLSPAGNPENLEHKLFVVMHRWYPGNHWTKRYRSWE